jgi:alginate production protein
VKVGGRPLVVSGELDASTAYVRRLFLEEDAHEPDRFLLETSLEVEAFYSFGPALSFFFQVEAVWDEDLLGNGFEAVSDFYVARGEMWLNSLGLFGLPLNFDIGRLDFEDDRRWWWDEQLDAARLEWEGDDFDLAVAVAEELGSDRSDHSWVEPENDDVFRVLGELSWDFADEHGFELFFLYHDDGSDTETPGAVVDWEREDDSDARLTWVGARMMGVFDFGSRGLVGYWADAGYVWGRERFLEFEELTRERLVLDQVTHRDVSGWGLDVGLQWLPKLAWEPRFFVGYAVGSGDSEPERGADRAYRQSLLQNNEAGFGGVERFNSYGVLLAPELSNLRILTVGAGISLLRSSSLDLVYHYYEQVDPAPFLRDARIEADLDGVHRDIGHEVDLVLALEEWERLEFEFIASGFRPGRAFGRHDGKWSYGGFFAVRFAF